MKRVLVTGATGFIGRHALMPLVARGFDVHAVARRPFHDDAATWHAADLLEVDELERLLDDVRPTHLLHLAWYTVHRRYWTSVENVRWVEASLLLLRRFREFGGVRAVLAGTCAEYDWSHGVCVERETPLAPGTLYGVSKDALRRIAEAYAAHSGLGLAWGRIFFLYGPHEHPDRLVSSVVRSLLANDPAPVSDGRQERDFLHVADVGSAFAALVDSNANGPVNIGSGERRSIREIVMTIAGSIGRPELVCYGAVRTGPYEPPLVVADVGRLRDEVRWRPRFSLERGIADTIDWWRAAAQPSASATVRES